MNRKKHMYFLVVSSLLLLTLSFSPPFKAVAQASNNQEVIPTSKEATKVDLYNKIQSYSEQHNSPAIDAKIDPIWKAIPGYNGLEINVEASYKKMKKHGKFDEKKIVSKEIPPKVSLEDLDVQPIYRGNPEKPMVAFLINVAWGNEYIPKILEVLKQHKTKATFFLDGSWTKKNPDVAKQIKDAGHEIGNHAYSHPDLQKRSMADTQEELKKTNAVIEQTLGIKPKWFAPPSGSFNETTVQVADQLNMKTILWTVDTVDWKKPAPTEMVNRVVSKIENGAMVLMHPTEPVAEGIDAMISEIKEKGYQLGTVTELMDEKRIK